MDYIALGKHVRTSRLSRRWTQEMLAEQVGISVSFLGHIERGTRKASLETLVSLANTLNVSVDALLRDSLRSPVEPALISSISKKKQLAIKEVVQAISDIVGDW